MDALGLIGRSAMMDGVLRRLLRTVDWIDTQTCCYRWSWVAISDISDINAIPAQLGTAPSTELIRRNSGRTPYAVRRTSAVTVTADCCRWLPRFQGSCLVHHRRWHGPTMIFTSRQIRPLDPLLFRQNLPLNAPPSSPSNTTATPLGITSE